MADKKAQIKELALLGSFKEIQEKHGETAFRRGKEYAESKLKTLRGLREAGDAVPENTSDFLVFAIDQNVEDDIEVIANKFHGSAPKADKEGSDDGWDSDATGPQVQEKPVAIPEEHEDPPAEEDDTMKVDDALGAENETQAQDEIQTQAQEQTEGEVVREAPPPVKIAPLPIKPKKGGFQLPTASAKFKPQQPKAPAEVTPGNKSDADDDDDDDTGSARNKKKASRSSSSSIKKVKAAKGDKIKVKTTSKKEKKEKKEKEEKISKSSFENLPKGAKTSYIIFGESERHVIKAENCALPAKEMMKEIGVRWNLLTDSEKAVWGERAAEDKIRYTRDYQEYTEEFPDEARRYEEWKAGIAKGGSTKKGKDKSESKKRKRSESSSDGKKAARKSRSKRSRKDSDDEDDDDDADDEEEVDMDIAVVNDDDDDDAGGKDEAEFDEKASRSAPHRRLKATINKTSTSTPRSRTLTPSTSVSKKLIKREPNESTQPPIVKVDPTIDNQRTAKLIAGLKGIKQSDLPQHEDIMQAKIVPVDRAPFPPDFKPTVGGHVVLILEPYREFVSELPLDFISQEEVQLVQSICSLTTATAVGKIIGVQPATSGGHGSPRASTNEEDGQGSQEGREDALFVKLNVGGDHYTVLYLPFASPMMRTDVFLIDKTAYDKLLKAPWMVPNAQVRRPFAADEDDGRGAEWLEGSIYDIRADFKKNPYRSVSVVWMKLEESPRRWFYAYTQTDNLCSPWDLSLSKYVLPEHIPSTPPLPASLQGHTVDAMSVLAYLKSFDFSSVFKYKISTNDEYCAMFPDRHDQLDFNVLDVRCSDGRYKGSNIATLFSDLELMIANGKQFNEENKDFQPWRLCDMMEKKVADLKVRLGSRVAPSTSSSSSSRGSSSSSSSSLLHPNNKKNRSTESSDNHLTSTFDGEAEETADLDALEQEEV